ncbi:uroporphyrinogen-III synthase [Curtobacterium sp. C2H10]|uniref:uroporphyrinogen-III synthase n=1 Tax=Curtobacterium sp. C2H10 TaxID=2736664 RepID=UPI0021C20DD1|nr:uroporphyrinogen-III synthase [Curtobacterium sp. C2H10]MCT9620034.1 uroporphyrinogen-III synthase [Curtobacterium sp. C2H10]
MVPRGGAWGDRVAAAARERGLDPLVVPLIADAAPTDRSALEAAVDRLIASGGSRRHDAPPPAGSGPQSASGQDAPSASGQDAPSASGQDAPSASGQDAPSAGRRAGGTGRPAASTEPDRAHSGPATDGTARADGTARTGGTDRTDGTDVAGYAWMVVTSATAVRVVAERVARLPSDLRVAAVGEPTARAVRAAGWVVDLVPSESSGAALAHALPDTSGTVLFPRSDLAAPTVVDTLRARGIDVDEVVAYRTVGTGDEPVVLDSPPAAVLVTSGSIAREIARRMTPLDPRTVIACIGPGTAAEARAAGLPVHVVARSRSAEALLDAVVESLNPTAPNRKAPK